MSKPILFFAAIVVFSECNCNITSSPLCQRIFEFEIPLSLTPSNDTIQVGDTLWLESFIPNQLADKKTNEIVDVTGFDFKIRANISRMEIESTPDALNDFTFINIFGNVELLALSSITKSKIHYNFTGNSQNLKVGLIPQKPGLYQISFYNLTMEIENVDITKNSECREDLVITYIMNDGKENNYYLLESSPGQVGTYEQFQIAGAYAFIVVD